MNVISQSLVKAIIDDNLEVNCCWRLINHRYIKKDLQFSSSLPMLQGCYFESKALGSTAHGDVVTELPLARGAESVATKRINIQTEVFNKQSELLGINPRLYAQHAIKQGDGDGWIRRGVLDVFPVEIFGKKCILDTKLTGTLDNGMSPFGWRPDDNCILTKDEKTGIEYYIGTPRSIDDIQSAFYVKLVKDRYGEDVDFVYWVFESGNKMRNAMFFAKPDFYLCETRVRAVKSMLTDRIKSGIFEEIPEKSRCKKCPLTCKKRVE